MTGAVEELSVPSRSGSVRNRNDLFGIVLPLSRIRPPLIFQGRSGTWRFGRMSLWSTCVGVQEGLAAALCGPS
jgi:hypothetical protein